MPMYEYRCKKGHTFDVIQSFADAALTKCEVCGAKAERVLSAPAIHFKGSGFYNTDYGTKRRAKENAAHASSESSKSAKSEKSDSSAATASDAGSSTKSESKKSEPAPSAAAKD
jgi:putative FmdB family regulatory protein